MLNLEEESLTSLVLLIDSDTAFDGHKSLRFCVHFVATLLESRGYNTAVSQRCCLVNIPKNE